VLGGPLNGPAVIDRATIPSSSTAAMPAAPRRKVGERHALGARAPATGGGGGGGGGDAVGAAAVGPAPASCASGAIAAGASAAAGAVPGAGRAL